MLSRIFSTLAALMLAAPLATWAQAPNDVGKAVQGPVLKAVISDSSCPSVYGVLGSNSVDLPGTSGIQTGRVFRNGVPSSCAVPKAWPGLYNSNPYSYDAYVLTNGTGSPQCVNMNLYVFSGETSTTLHVAVYAGSFNPSNVQTNYLADSGSSASPGSSTYLSFTVAAGQTVVAVVHNPFSTQTGTPYYLSYDNLCVSYDRSYLDDQGRCMICYNSTTGQYKWSIFKGLGAGGIWTGQAAISNGGNTLLSSPGDTQKLTFYVYANRNSAYGVFHPLSFGSSIGSVLGDVNISDDPPSDCIRIIETLPK